MPVNEGDLHDLQRRIEQAGGLFQLLTMQGPGGKPMVKATFDSNAQARKFFNEFSGLLHEGDTRTMVEQLTAAVREDGEERYEPGDDERDEFPGAGVLDVSTLRDQNDNPITSREDSNWDTAFDAARPEGATNAYFLDIGNDDGALIAFTRGPASPGEVAQALSGPEYGIEVSPAEVRALGSCGRDCGDKPHSGSRHESPPDEAPPRPVGEHCGHCPEDHTQRRKARLKKSANRQESDLNAMVSALLEDAESSPVAESTVSLTITRPDPETEEETELQVDVELDMIPAERGSRDRYGVPLEPDLPATAEVTKVTVKDAAMAKKFGEIELTDAETDKAIDQALEDAGDSREAVGEARKPSTGAAQDFVNELNKTKWTGWSLVEDPQDADSFDLPGLFADRGVTVESPALFAAFREVEDREEPEYVYVAVAPGNFLVVDAGTGHAQGWQGSAHATAKAAVQELLKKYFV